MRRVLILCLPLLLGSCIAAADAREPPGCEPPNHCHEGCVCTGNYGSCGRQDGSEGVVRDCKCTCGHSFRGCRAN